MNIIRLTAALFAVALGACTTIPVDANFQARETAKATALGKCSESDDVTGCMLGVALVFSDPYQRAPTGLEQATGMAKVVTPGLVALGSSYAGTVQAGYRRDVDIAEATTVERIVLGSADRMAAVAEGALPDITVGGNYGNTQTIGGDLIGGDRVETSVGGNLGDTQTSIVEVGRDQTGGDHIDNSGNYGTDNRQDSPGPIDNSDDGDDCSGESCNPITPEIDP